MIEPAPTSSIDPRLARGILIEQVEATATRPAYLRIGFPNTDYQLHLIPEGELSLPEPGGEIVGTIHAQARRIDTINAGGRFIDPVLGVPRRVQGRVISVDGEKNEVIVSAGVPVHCHPTDARQNATDFHPGDFVTMGIEPGAVFLQES